MPLAPHSIMSALGTAASIHVCASIPNFLIQESRLADPIVPDGLLTASFEANKDGFATLPTAPGLGVEVHEAHLADFEKDPKRQFRWPVPRAKDGAVSDY